MIDKVAVEMLEHTSHEVTAHSITFPIGESDIKRKFETLNGDWIFFFDARIELEKNFQEELSEYVLSVQEKVKVIVDQKLWLPFLLRKDWLEFCLRDISGNISLYELHACIRKQDNVNIYSKKWPVVKKARPSVKERVNISILKKWWMPFESDYIQKESEKYVQQTPVMSSCKLSAAEYEEYVQTNYDILEVNYINEKQWMELLEKFNGYVTVKYFETSQKYILFSGYDESRDGLKKNERSVGQMIWLKKVKEKLAETGYVVFNLRTESYGNTVYSFQHKSRFVIKKEIKEKRDTAVLIDLPGIGDAVRLVQLFPEICEKYSDSKVTAIVSSKCVRIYELCPEIDSIFICSLRPDLPKFPYIVPSLLKEYFITHPFQHIISLAWDTVAYLNNRKQNFFTLYAELAGVQGKKRTSLRHIPTADEKVLKVFAAEGVSRDRPIAGIQFSASMPSKSWSDSVIFKFIIRFRQLVPNVQIVNLDYHDIEMDVVYNVGKYFDIIEFMAAMKLCDYFIGVDSAGVHIAALLNVPCLTIYGKEKPRVGDDHRPISDINISMIPAEDCECPEYIIECSKSVKCIDTVSDETVLYALSKGNTLHYNKSKKEIQIPVRIQQLWNTQFHHKRLVLENISEACIERSQYGVISDVSELSGEIKLGSINELGKLEFKTLGIDLWIEENTFELSSYAMFWVEIMDESGKKKVFSHRLMEGWNLLHFKIGDNTIQYKMLNFKVTAKRKLKGKICINSVYTFSLD